MTTIGLSLRCHAKLNLWLKVTGRRADGYHLLDTCFQTIDLADELALLPARAGQRETTLQVDAAAGTGLPVAAGADNLVLRAASAFAAATGIATPMRFVLRKAIPAGAGLGGGSSDAAATLRLLQAQHGAPLSDGELGALAVRLGADVPFFLRGGTQIGRGIGDELTPWDDAPSFRFVLVLPPFGTSTAAVYKNLNPELTMPSEAASVRRASIHSVRGLDVPDSWANDLEEAACRSEPALAVWLHRLRTLPLAAACLPETGPELPETGASALGIAASGVGTSGVGMSGSGSTLFVRMPASTEPERIARVHDALRPFVAQGARVVDAHSVAANVAGAPPETVRVTEGTPR